MNKYSAFGNCYSIAVKYKNYTLTKPHSGSPFTTPLLEGVTQSSSDPVLIAKPLLHPSNYNKKSLTLPYPFNESPWS